MKKVSANRSQGEDYACPVKPERTSYGGNVGAKAKLEKQRGKADGGNDDQCEGTQKRSVTGIDDDECKGHEKQAGGDEGRAAARIRTLVGRGFGHEVPSSDLYRSLGKVFKLTQGLEVPDTRLRVGSGSGLADAGKPLCRARIAVVHSVENQFDSRRDTQLVEDAKQILFDGVLAEIQLLSGVTIT